MVALVIPVWNGGERYRECLDAVAEQVPPVSERLVMESGSKDGSRALSLQYGFRVHDVAPGTFNHGGTRSDALQLVDDDIIVFLTQDAILDDPRAIANLVAAFDDPAVGAAYGRQLPHRDANLFAEHARATSYTAKSYVTSMEADFPVGIRKCFASNSFAAYRRTALEQVGGFPRSVILSEDAYAVARMLQKGWKVAYVAEAKVRHSHNYTLREEFSRYFDIGVFHSMESWLLETFGRPEGEGARIAIDQIRFCLSRKRPDAAIRSVAMSGAKFLGYKLGSQHARLGVNWSRRLAMHKGFFRANAS